jgi:hypothetical protein
VEGDAREVRSVDGDGAAAKGPTASELYLSSLEFVRSSSNQPSPHKQLLTAAPPSHRWSICFRFNDLCTLVTSNAPSFLDHVRHVCTRDTASLAHLVAPTKHSRPSHLDVYLEFIILWPRCAHQDASVEILRLCRAHVSVYRHCLKGFPVRSDVIPKRFEEHRC